MHGWTGTIQYVNLSDGSCRREPLAPDLLHTYLGGRGLGVRLMREFHRLDPFSPEMPLIFATGPLCGTPAPTTARMTVVSRSPLTGTIFSSSAGGLFPWRMKAAGIDVLFVTGRSPAPVCLILNDAGAELVPADPLWGKTIPETAAALRDRGSVAAIGPAGENGVLFASIGQDTGGAFARGGLGAVMGDKRLKAVVADGSGTVEIADRDRFDRARQDVLRLFNASPVIFGELGFANFGTPALVDLIRQRRMSPTENFRSTVFAGAAGYGGPAIRNAYAPEGDGCHGCPVECRKRTPTGEPLPDYDAVSHFGGLNANADLATIVRCNALCGELGMDPVSTAATLSAWGEARGRFASADEMPSLLADIARRRGEGELLALGSQQAMGRLGRPEFSMSVKGLELPAYDPRGAYGLALAYCTSSRGGCHLQANPVSHEILRKPVATDRFTFSGKARIIKIAEDGNAAADSLVACGSAFFGATLEEYGELVSAATGREFPPCRLLEIGERIFMTERFYNCANGFTRKDDVLPERFFTDPGSSGEGIEIPHIDRERFEVELQKYYRIRGLSEEGTFADRLFLERQP